MKEKKKISIFWFRRDLRLDDNCGLFHALSGDLPVLPLFIFDTHILNSLVKNDHRIEAIHKRVIDLNSELKNKYKSSLMVRLGKPIDVYKKLIQIYDIQSVYTNTDYEPYANKRDTEIKKFLADNEISFNSYKDQVIFEKSDLIKNDGKPYVVYTPYMKRWQINLKYEKDLVEYNTDIQNYIKDKNLDFLTLSNIGFEPSDISLRTYNTDSELINNYGKNRDYPALEATSYIGYYLRFGLVSIRKLVKLALLSQDDTYLKELVWREFFMQIMWHFPYTQHRAFREKYDFIQWRESPEDLQKWKEGKTGYPLVDAGMRELNQTGYMHNRVRMVVASFLCKHLLINWTEGEKYFAEKLFDYELSSNVGNWQWAAGSGVDAAPYFRVFNPELQMKKFDPHGHYVRKWVPEYFGFGYVEPMVNHSQARERAIETYKRGLSNFDK